MDLSYPRDDVALAATFADPGVPMKCSLRATAFSCFSILILLSGCSSSRAPLVMKFKEGDVHKVSFKNTVVRTVSRNSKPLVATSSQDCLYTLRVKKLQPDGSAEMEITVEHFRADFSNPSLAAIPGFRPQDLMDTFGESLAGKSFVFTLNQIGKVGTIVGLQTINKSISEDLQHSDFFKPFPASVRSTILNEARKEFRFEDSDWRAEIEGLFRVHRAEPVGVGSTWRGEFRLPVGESDVTAGHQYALTERADGVVHIEMDSQLKASQRDIEAYEGGSVQSFESDGRVSATVQIDDASGWIIRDEAAIDADTGFVSPDGERMHISLQIKRHIETSLEPPV